MPVKVTVDTSGFRKALDDMKHRVEDVKDRGAAGVPLTEILTDSFMREHTDCQNADEFFQASGMEIKTAADMESTQWNNHVANHSKFADWGEMYAAAGTAWVVEKMKGLA